MLYIDPDVIIFRNIDKLFTVCQDQFMVLRDFNRWRQVGWKKFNSSVVRWNTGQHPQIYKQFVADTINVSKKIHGDQDWLYAQVKKDFQYFPDEWIQSYKWEMRGMPINTRCPRTQKFCVTGVPKINLRHPLLCFMEILILKCAVILGAKKTGVDAHQLFAIIKT